MTNVEKKETIIIKIIWKVTQLDYQNVQYMNAYFTFIKYQYILNLFSFSAK